MEKDYQIIELTQDSEDSLWQLRYDFGMKYKKPSDAGESNWLEYKERVCQRIIKDHHYRNCLILTQQELWTAFTVQLRGEEKKELLIVLSFGENNPDQELLTQLLNYLSHLYKQECKLFIYTNRHFSPDLRSHFKLKRKERDVCLLKREDFNLQKATEFINGMSENNKNLSFQFYDNGLPEEMYDEFAKVGNDVSNDMPQMEIPKIYNQTAEGCITGERKDRENGVKTYRMLAFDENKRIIGISNLWQMANPAEYPYQFMTGVVREFRGKKISSWLKTAMYLKLFTEKPEIKGIVTEMITNNSFIQNVNNELGFIKIGQDADYVMAKDEFNKLRVEN